MFSYTVEPYELQFIKPAKTSRNVFKTRKIFIINIYDSVTGKNGIGEAAPLSLLSVDDVSDYEDVLHSKLESFCEKASIEKVDLDLYPSIRFGLESAVLNLHSEDHQLFNTSFTRGEQPIPINGLVWMNDTETMFQEALQKIEQGFKVIKFKVGAQDFDEECKMLEKIRKKFSAFSITIRLDANGAFKADEALEQLNELRRFEVHSIEQPIAVNNWDKMEEICYKKPIDIALDEELIGVNVYKAGISMLKLLKPQCIILKPNLLGGLKLSDEWIKLAHGLGIDWWATSALESNIGLNAIAQWVSQYPIELHQGLGTGSLFSNNIQSKLKVENGNMYFKL